MKKRIILIGGIVLLATLLVFFVGLKRKGQESSSESTKEKYKRKVKEIVEETVISEEEFEEVLLSLVTFARNELGHWREQEKHWKVKTGPDYQSYKISKKDYEELLRRLQVFVAEEIYEDVEEGKDFSTSKKLTKAKISSFDRLIQRDGRLIKGLFK